MVHPLTRSAVVVGLFCQAACSSGPHQSGASGAALKVSVAPLDLRGVEDAIYTVSVVNALEQTVWSRTLSSDQYGDGDGDLTYVGPCDASEDANPNVVTVTLDALIGESGEALDEDAWRRPPPLVKEVACLPNADVLVSFSLTVLRSAQQGFFDVAVDFDDIFCSAKMDCQDALLHRPGPEGARDLTAVVAFACTAGTLSDGTAEETFLYWGEAAIVCRDGDTVVQRYPLATHFASGNQGPIRSTTGDPVLGVFQSATYRGTEDFDDFEKCYSNFALGLDTGILGANCTFEATATASSGRFDPELQTPPDTTYPIIRWAVPLTRAGALVCAPNAVNAPGSFVQTEYTDGAHFETGMACGGEPFTRGVTCTGTAETEPEVTFIPQPDGRVMVQHDGQTYGPFALPEGTSLSIPSAECCVDPCCEETP